MNKCDSSGEYEVAVLLPELSVPVPPASRKKKKERKTRDIKIATGQNSVHGGASESNSGQDCIVIIVCSVMIPSQLVDNRGIPSRTLAIAYTW